MAAVDVLIVGAGHGGAQAAIALRQRGFAGTIAIVGDEPELPYERPPLSKDFLAGGKSFERLLIRPESFWAERNVIMLLGRRVERIDPEARRAILGSGEALGYGTLIWAAGGRPRRVRGAYAIRTRADVDRILAALPAATRITVIGGGYIGLEAAAVLRTMGKQVTVLEAQDRLLARVAGEPISRFFEQEHRNRGVDIRTGADAQTIEASSRQADLVIAGIGIDPNIEPLAAAGAAVCNGVHVDAFCRTILPHVFAIGDCAAHENAFAGGARLRLESVQNANDQATTAAKAILGEPAPYTAVPWFWSNQYDLRLQTVGLAIGHDQTVVRGDPDSRSFSVIYLRGGAVAALDCINNVRDYAQGKALVQQGARIPLQRLADTSTPLKAMLSA